MTNVAHTLLAASGSVPTDDPLEPVEEPYVDDPLEDEPLVDDPLREDEEELAEESGRRQAR